MLIKSNPVVSTSNKVSNQPSAGFAVSRTILLWTLNEKELPCLIDLRSAGCKGELALCNAQSFASV
jgi:hypothetical protein